MQGNFINFKIVPRWSRWHSKKVDLTENLLNCGLVMFLCTFLLIYKFVTSAKLNKSYHYVVQPTFSLKGFIFVSIRTKTACGIKCRSGHKTENGKAPKRVLYHHDVGHWRAFCELGYSRDCSDCFLGIFFSFYCVDAFQSDDNSNTGYDLGHKHVLGPTQSL